MNPSAPLVRAACWIVGAALLIAPTHVSAANRVVVNLVDAGAAGDPTPPPQPGPPRPESDTTTGVPGGLGVIDEGHDVEPVVSGQASGTIVHVINTKPDEDRGFLKLARYVDTSSVRSGDTLHVTVRYEELCREPCGVPVDTSDRPIFFFMRDGNAVSKGFRLPQDSGPVTLKVKPRGSGMVAAGWVLTCLLILPVGIPLMVAGGPRVWIAEGAPSDELEFRRLRPSR